ncbi:hypothetical protein HK16_01990 [Acetobacter senegalensis]|uniref:Uncharacterized protein n=2 Tax=Acetobacter TaxID=434 RepID=A0A252EE76_9PROT|nr:hypothetical protein CIW82_08565 [Acetobacter tropicalis]OUL64745.1 hypothetical protein HK16_01990 [Acetobacter senegalensis]
MTKQNYIDYRKKYEELLEKMEVIRDIGEDPFMPNLSYQLTAAQLEATLQVKQSIDDMRTALQQLIRMQATGAKVP